MAKVLIVDDSLTNIAMLINILSEEYEVLTAKDGMIALETLENAGYDVDLVLLDIIMPGIDGYEVCRILKDRPESRNIPIIMLSGLDSNDSKVKAFEVGAIDYITKPFHEEEVIARVHTHIELYHLRQNLMHLVEEKSRELLEKEKILIHNAKMAELGEMMGMIAHQWRQPLNAVSAAAINLNLRAEMDLLVPEEIHEISRNIQTQTKNMSETINDFMNLCKPETKASPFTLKEVFADIRKLVGSQLQSRGINCQQYIDETITLLGHEREFIHVMLNLITNARDALSDNGKDEKTIVVRANQADGVISISVCDNGTGIAPDILPLIFDPYFTTKQEGEGTGIGLYMVNEILRKKYNATIRVMNRTEGGVCFEISIPASQDS